jgi:thiol-disulfide isomerase/thioredoxin
LRWSTPHFSYVTMRDRLLDRPLLAVLALLAAGSLTACRASAVRGETDAPTAHLHALVVNGGASQAQNYQSHFLHVQRLVALLEEAGVARERITIFDADGPDPAADMAVREVQPEAEFWRLRGTRLEGPLATPIVYANTALPGFSLEPATRRGIEAWFKSARRRLRAGDSLLLYVTDHGTKNAEDTTNNKITLWGDKESLSVRELKGMLATLDPGVHVVSLMSQCYSGAFAALISAHARGGAPSGATCGYFSSTPDRPAYGCYPENRGKDNVGHSFHFLEALARSHSLPAAHVEVLATDRTPDVPIRSSDVYLEELLTRAAEKAGQERADLINRLLREAWEDKAAWEPDIRLLDRIAHAFGFFSPRSLAELEDQTKSLPDLSDQLKSHGRAWQEALGDLQQTNLERLLARDPAWAKRADLGAVASLDPAGRRALTADLLARLVDFTHADGAVDARLRMLRDKGETASKAAYRMEVRLAAVLRLRAVLTSIAGRVWIATHASSTERGAYERLRSCEDLPLGPPPVTAAAAPTPDPFPPYDDDVKLAREVLPAWMGINFRQANEKTRTTRGLKDGAATVLTVYPDSPAKAAGLEVGDTVIGPPGHPFTEPRQIREWTMLSVIDRPEPLLVQRGEQQVVLTLVPKPYPIRLPELPGPPKVGSPAPEVSLSAYRGSVPTALADGHPHLLFFWATWCGPCKAAIPELLAFERERGTQVIAITDEPAEHLDPFFQKYEGSFPATIAVDEFRRAFQAYAVSGTPTFVLIDAAGKVASQATGYTPDKGLTLEGWTWSGRAAASTN